MSCSTSIYFVASRESLVEPGSSPVLLLSLPLFPQHWLQLHMGIMPSFSPWMLQVWPHAGVTSCRCDLIQVWTHAGVNSASCCIASTFPCYVTSSVAFNNSLPLPLPPFLSDGLDPFIQMIAGTFMPNISYLKDRMKLNSVFSTICSLLPNLSFLGPSWWGHSCELPTNGGLPILTYEFLRQRT